MLRSQQTLRASSLALLILAHAIFPTHAIAQDAPAEEEVPDSIIPLQEGEAAPFSGMLIPADRLMAWRAEIERLRFRLRVDVEAAQDIAEIRLDAAQASYEVRLEYANDVAATYREIAARPQPFWRHPMFVMVLTIVLVSGAYLAVDHFNSRI